MSELRPLLASTRVDAPVKAPADIGSPLLRSGSVYAAGVALTAVTAVVSAETRLGLLAPVGLACVVALLLTLWARPHLLAPLVIIGFALQPDLKFFGSTYFGPAKDLVAVCAIVVLAVRVANRRWRSRLDCDPWIVSGVLAVLMLYVLDLGGSHDSAWAAAVRPVIEAFGLFLAAYLLLRDANAWRLCVRMMLAMGIIEAVAGCFEQLVGQNFLANTLRFPYNTVLTTVSGLPRSFGTQLDPFNYAAMVALAVPFAFFAMSRGRRQVITIALLGAGLIAALVRTSVLIAYALVLLALVRTSRAASAGFLLAASVLGVVAVLALSQSSSPQPSSVATLNGRTSEWSRVLHPQIMIAGAGAGNIGSGTSRSLQGSIVQIQKQGSQSASSAPASAAATSIDSSYLALISDVGLPGLALVIAVFARIVAVGLQATRRGATAGPILLGMVLVVAIDGATRSSLTQFPFGYIALFAIGAGLAAAERQLRQPRPATERAGELLVSA